MRTEVLLRQTRRHFPRFNVDEIKITPIEKGGSDRKFYRVRCSSEQSLILVKYNLEREENRHYVEIAQFLETHGIHAPRIYYHDVDEGLIWLEDLGERDLFGYRDEPWLVRRAFYESVWVRSANSINGRNRSASRCISICRQSSMPLFTFGSRIISSKTVSAAILKSRRA